MLIQLLIQQPQMLGPILKNTPSWVWGLAAALTALGLSQVRTRSVSALRMLLMPLAMTGLSLWGTISAFSHSPLFGYVLLAWAAGAALLLAAVALSGTPAGASYQAAAPAAGPLSSMGSFVVPGSWLPLLLILGIFLTKYVVGVELTMQPALAWDGVYTLVVGGLYGLFSGAFAGRSARLWRLALRPSAGPAPAASVA